MNKIELVSQQSPVKPYEEDIKQFVLEEYGSFLVYTDDSIIVKLLRHMFSFHLQLQGDCLRFAKHDEELIKDANQIHTAHGKALFFIERVAKNQDNAQLIRLIKVTYPGSMIMMLTGETEREAVIYMHEIGADNFLVKPVSVSTLIEKTALTLRPQGHLAKLARQGKELLQQGEYKKAQGIAEEILAFKPNSPVALMILGDALGRTEQGDEALQAYLSAASHAKLYLEPLKKIADYYKERKDLELQLKYLEKLDQLSPLNVERKVEIGQIHIQQGRTDEAERYFQAATTIVTKQAKDLVNSVKLAVAEVCMQHDPKLAERYFREIVGNKTVLSNADVHVFNRLGIALRKQGKWEEAIKEFKKVCKVADSADTIYYNIAMAYIEGKRYHEAHDAVHRALALNREELLANDVVAFNIGLTMQYVHKNGEAKEIFSRIRERNPSFPGIDKQLSALAQT
ncbi:MAG TPA: tetratricopeptide repeat protein [Desulfonatronum sp.]|nr:tetratricopeptide repeat protein [Desulfonatronum sp.]